MLHGLVAALALGTVGAAASAEKSLGSADMKGFMANLGAEPHPTTPQEFGTFIRSELAKWAKVVKESGARAE